MPQQSRLESPREAIARLESDIAYFDARLALLGEPATIYGQAQRKVYRLLQGRLIEALILLKAQAMIDGIESSDMMP